VATGADVVVNDLAKRGVEVCFGLPGVHNLPIWSALRESERIRLVGVRHEQAAVYAADGYARATGRAGVALVTTGPGAANTLGAVGEAWASGSPVVVIATDIPKALRRPGVHRGVLHECVDQAGMFGPVVKASFAVGRVEDLAFAVERALGVALEHPQRPVYLQVPTDLLSAELPGAASLGIATPEIVRERAVPHPEDVQAAAALLARARRPLIWAGGGALRDGARRAVASFAERLAAPVLLTYGGRGLLAPDHPCLVGLPPHVPEAGALWDEADVVVAIGTDFDGMMTQNWGMPQPPRMVALNLDAADAAKNYAADVVIRASAGDGLAALAELLPPRPGVAALRDRLAAVRSAALARLRGEQPDELAFLDAFAAALPPETIVLADMCIPGYWLAGFHRVPAPRRLQYPVGWGTLGYAFPAAVGAAFAGPVVSVSGDGGFLFACGELATVAQERLPLTAVIVDDGGYGMLRFDQARADTPPFGVDLATPDFAAMAESFGVRAETVDGLADEFGAALARHVADPEPSVLVARAALEPPPTTSPRWYRRG
jgi:thiamine pyrophosphate-dependent acetolactate synthase large subunit-like protein